MRYARGMTNNTETSTANFVDPTGLFDGHIDGAMHDGCPCRACAFSR
jgi:hypothetical protein